jgi:tRNA(fMet)-specific endonuclease VapC
MATRYLLDTDTCIFLHRHRPASVVTRFEKLTPGEAAMSVVTYGELMFGAFKGPNPAAAMPGLSKLAVALPVLSMPQSAGEIYGELRARLEAAGEIIGGNDLWIAAHALASGLVLVTNNEREFKRVPGLKFENWAK